jgi:phospholipid/cholesterol/gamma-HCH transport system substrate-binding protein
MNRNVLETVMGALVLAVALIFLAFAYSSAGIQTVTGYDVTAKFDRIDGVRPGTDVRIGGVKIGTVTATTLDPKTFQANVRMTIDGAYKLPVDTVAQITSTSLLGDNFMKLVPGSDEKDIAADGAITNTIPPTDIWQMMSNALYSVSSGSSSSSGSGPSSSGPKPPEPSSPGATPSAPSDHKT